MKTTKVSAMALACLLTLGAVACGSKKSSDAVNADSGAFAEKQSDSGGTSSTSKDTSLASGLDALGASGECLQTSLAYAALLLEPLGFAGGASQDDLNQFEQQTQDLKAKIPDEIKGEFETVADAYKAYGDELKGLDFSDLLNPDTQKKLEDASAQINSPEVKAAQDKIEAYFKDKCGN
jgi:outer membrane murein-binding lipoprotein Lpp